ncbi:MAG TPA: SHOCT domain-containing protein [Candidatus Limnocylindrales bacterium]|jgi:hypothetical protein|nr:SHOCT domain-containing protein [Candidatus Limnocylindrales bacterium]
MEIIAGWLIWSGLVAWIASVRGRSPVGWFFLSVLLSPLIGIIAVLVAPNRRAATIPVAAPMSSAPSTTDTLRELGDLRDRGVITAEDFEAKKGDLLRRL